jgi:hypothetical protein
MLATGKKHQGCCKIVGALSNCPKMDGWCILQLDHRSGRQNPSLGPTFENKSQTDALSTLTVALAASYRFSYNSACREQTHAYHAKCQWVMKRDAASKRGLCMLAINVTAKRLYLLHVMYYTCAQVMGLHPGLVHVLDTVHCTLVCPAPSLHTYPPTCVSAPASRSSVSLSAVDLVRSMAAPP